jgi:hypothetical protein
MPSRSRSRVASSVRKRVPVRIRPRARCGCSSAGRAPPRHGGGHGFEARYPLEVYAVLAQREEAPRSRADWPVAKQVTAPAKQKLRWRNGQLTWPSTRIMPVRARHGARPHRPWVRSGTFISGNRVRVPVGLLRGSQVRLRHRPHKPVMRGFESRPRYDNKLTR